jgi:hypothetical protein
LVSEVAKFIETEAEERLSGEDRKRTLLNGFCKTKKKVPGLVTQQCVYREHADLALVIGLVSAEELAPLFLPPASPKLKYGFLFRKPGHRKLVSGKRPKLRAH